MLAHEIIIEAYQWQTRGSAVSHLEREPVLICYHNVPENVTSYDTNNKYLLFDVSLTVHLSITLDNDQLDVQIFLIHLLQSSKCTCFEQYLAHPQEVKLY
jgi:hypothetical protein